MCHIRSFVGFYSSPYSPLYPHRFQIDKDNFPTSAFPDIDFVNSVCPCAGLSMLNTQSTGASGRGNGIQNEWMVKSAHFVLSQVSESESGMSEHCLIKVLNIRCDPRCCGERMLQGCF